MTRKPRYRRIAILLAGCLIVGAYFPGRNVPFSVQWPLFEALRTTAAIIFAVVGAWLAIVYPERLRWAFRGDHAEAPKGNNTIRNILSPAINSTFILCIILVLGVLAPLIIQIETLYQWKKILRGISYSLLIGLTLWQLATIVLTLPIADKVITESDKEALRVQVNSHHFDGAQHRE